MNEFPALDPLDRRLNAFNADVADSRLKGSVVAAQFTDGEPFRIAVPVADLVSSSDTDGSAEAQLLFGHTVRVFDKGASRAFVQADHNDYVGWMDRSTLDQGAFVLGTLLAI